MTVWKKRPSPALLVAMIALFVALGGTAGAVVTAAVPLAKRALVADNAKKLGGQTAGQIASQAASQAGQVPGPASTAAALVSGKSTAFSLAAQQEQLVTATCDAGSKAVGGGFNNPSSGLVLSAGSYATADGSGWTEDLINLSSSNAGSGTVVVQCLK